MNQGVIMDAEIGDKLTLDNATLPGRYQPFSLIWVFHVSWGVAP
jgi:hypothetical protein